jgi:hypothetical protein
MKKIILITFVSSFINCFSQNSEVVTDGFTSPIHEKYSNKIVFASKTEHLAFKEEIETEFKSEFNLGELIYFRVFLDNSLINYLSPIVKETDELKGQNSTFKMVFYIDNVIIENLKNDNISLTEFSSSEKGTRTTFKGAFKSEYDADDMIGKDVFKEMIRIQEAKLTPGKHELRMEIVPIYLDPVNSTNTVKGNVVASGSITLNVKEVIINPADPNVCMPLAVKSDPALEAKMSKYYFNEFKSTCDVVKIYSDNWVIEKNNLTGVNMSRHIDAYFGYKATNGACYKQLYIVSQEFDGTKFVDKMDFLGNYFPTEINCKCLQSKP